MDASACTARCVARAQREIRKDIRHCSRTDLVRRFLHHDQPRRRHRLALLPLSRVRNSRASAQHDLEQLMRPLVRKPVRMLAPRNAQRGVVLFIALIVLVAMTLAGIGMMRSVDTNNLIAGNLAFMNAALSAGDAAIEVARNWVMSKTAGQLEADQPGYFAN